MGLPLNPNPYTILKPEEMAPCLSASISPVLPARYKSLTQDFFPHLPVRCVPLAATVILLACPPAPFVQQVRTIPRAEAPRQQLVNSALLAVTAALRASRPAFHVLLDISALSAAPLSARPARLVSFAQPKDQVQDFRAPRATTAPPPPPFKPPARKTLTALRKNRRRDAPPAPRESCRAPVQPCALHAFPAPLTPRRSPATPLQAKLSLSWPGACVYL